MRRDRQVLLVAALALAACRAPDRQASPARPSPPIAETLPVTEAVAAPTAAGAARQREASRGSLAVRLGEGMVAPKRLSGDLREADKILNSGRFAGSLCLLEAVISEEGRVTDLTWLKPEGAAAEAKEAIAEAMKAWRFSPATRDGKPIAVYYTLTILHCPCLPKAAG